MADQKISDDTLLHLRDEGVATSLIAAKYGLNIRTLQRRLIRLAKQFSVPPLADPVPEGFEVRQISTILDSKGNKRLQAVQSRPAGLDAEDGEVIPAGHLVKGVSTLLGEDGTIRAQWVKTSRDTELAALAQVAAVEEAMKGVPAMPFIPPQLTVDSDLATLITLTDCHVGMLAWGKETKAAPWDLEIAERVLTETFMRMIDAAPNSALGIINQLGDFLHFDSLMPLTPASGHVLDADSRYQKVVQTVVRILEKIILHALTKFERVQVYMHEGNHDPAGSVWLRVLFSRMFRDNPRVTVELSPNPYQAMEFGKVMLGFHHGHLAKKTKLPAVFSAMYAPMWGRTEYRYTHTGHYHEVQEQEFPGMQVLQHPTIASPDAYAARSGYLSKRQAMSITYHKERGEIARNIFLPEGA